MLPSPRAQSQDDNELYSNLVESVVNVRRFEGEFVNSVHIDKSEDLQGRIAKSKMWWFENLSSSSTVVEVLINGYKLPFIVNTIRAILIVPEKKVQKAKAVLNGLLLDFLNVRVSDVARIAGFLISFALAMGSVTRIFTRQMYLCVQMRSSWSERLHVSSEFLDEVRF